MLSCRKRCETRCVRRRVVRGFHPRTIGADTGDDTVAWVAEMRALGVTPQVAQNITTKRGSAIDGRATRHPGYAVSQRKQKRMDEDGGRIPADALPGTEADTTGGLHGRRRVQSRADEPVGAESGGETRGERIKGDVPPRGDHPETRLRTDQHDQTITEHAPT